MVSQTATSEQVSDSLLLLPDDKPRKRRKTDQEAKQLKAWRSSAADALAAAGMTRESNLFRQCESDFLVDTCSYDVTHEPRIVKKTCHLRYCPPCEERDQARRLQRYVRPIWDMVNFAPRGTNLRKFELTTPYPLDGEDAPQKYKLAWTHFEECLRSAVYETLLTRKKLSPEEIRRKRADMKKHHVGALACAEFGEDGHKLHFHCVILSPFLPVGKLVETWQEVTSDVCKVAYIRAIDNSSVDDELKEVIKYVTKFTKLEPNLVPALANVLKSVRRMRTYGIFQGIKPEKKEPCLCKVCENRRKLVNKLIYVDQCLTRGVPIDDEITEAFQEFVGGLPNNAEIDLTF